MIIEETGTTLSEGSISLILPAAGHERAADELKQEFFDHGERMIHGSALLDQLP